MYRPLTEFHRNRLSSFLCNYAMTGCSRAAATICPCPGLQRKPAAAALSQAGRAGPDQPIRAIQPAGRTLRPPTGCTRQTSDVRQHHRLMPPGRWRNKRRLGGCKKNVKKNVCDIDNQQLMLGNGAKC